MRRHHAGAQASWVLHDQRTDDAYRLGAREWGLVSHADGTRDLEGILAAAARAGTFARLAALEAFLGALHEAGLLADGVGPIVETKPRAVARPLDPLPAFSLTCDGQGSCCRFFASIVFRPTEEAYARALLPRVLDAGERPENAFLPLYGSAPCGASAVGLVDGRCAYLEPRGRCGLHAAQGPYAKPLGCRTFPAHFVDDGEAVRVAPSVACSCVLASVLSPGKGSPLVPLEARTSHDLDEGISIEELPAEQLVTPDHLAPRRDLVGWTRALALAPPPDDVARALASLACSVVSEGLDPAAALRALVAPAPIDPRALRPLFASLAARADRRARTLASYRTDADLARRSVRWLLDAATLLAGDERALARLAEDKPSPLQASSEAFYLRAGAHAYRLVSGDAPISEALRDRAARVLLSRALPHVVRPDEHLEEPALNHPLALVEATLRGFFN